MNYKLKLILIKSDESMFNKKLFVILVFLLFILHIPFVNAQSDNQTEIINESGESVEYSEINNFSIPEFEDNIEPNNPVDQIEFYRGVMPIHIDSPAEGDLKVFVDDMEYGVWNFTKNKTIYIPTYNSESFYNNSKINIDVGLHNISLIFNFKKFNSKDVNIFLDENSTLNFIFKKNYSSHITNTYVYNSTLNILKKDRTIHILNFTYYDLYQRGEYVVHVDNLDLWDDEYAYGEELYDEIFGCVYGIIIMKNGELIHKNSYEDSWTDNVIVWGSLFDVNEVGIYNFTVINFIDGTMDSVLFKANKYQPKINVTSIVDGNNIKINLMVPEIDSVFLYEVLASISVDNVTKKLKINARDYIEPMSFENLTSGVHTLKVYCPGDNMSEEFYYTMSFEIEDNFDLKDGNETIFNPINNTDQNIQQNSSSDKNLSFIKGNTTSGNITSPGRVIKNQSVENYHSNENNVNSKENIINFSIGDDNAAQSGSSSPTKKSYEISKKSTSKKINEITQFHLIILVIILLIIGYFKFGGENIKKED